LDEAYCCTHGAPDTISNHHFQENKCAEKNHDQGKNGCTFGVISKKTSKFVKGSFDIALLMKLFVFVRYDEEKP
jgi:hypothetical protein